MARDGVRPNLLARLCRDRRSPRHRRGEAALTGASPRTPSRDSPCRVSSRRKARSRGGHDKDAPTRCAHPRRSMRARGTRCADRTARREACGPHQRRHPSSPCAPQLCSGSPGFTRRRVGSSSEGTPITSPPSAVRTSERPPAWFPWQEVSGPPAHVVAKRSVTRWAVDTSPAPSGSQPPPPPSEGPSPTASRPASAAVALGVPEAPQAAAANASTRKPARAGAVGDARDDTGLKSTRAALARDPKCAPVVRRHARRERRSTHPLHAPPCAIRG
jgi:hypothetical protein